MDKRFWAIIGVIVVVFGGIVFVNNHKKNDQTSLANGKVTASEHVKGKLDSKVTLVEYGDFQCSVCQTYYDTLSSIQTKYGDTVKFQFRHLPLLQVHPNAFAAARAAEAAGQQGKFWEMYDALYNPARWSDWTNSKNPSPLFKQYAKELGLDVTKFTKDSASSTVNGIINTDIAEFQKTGQEMATPTFFVNGKYVPNTKFTDASGPSVEAFSKVLDEALKSAE